MEIRLAREDDIDAVSALLASAYAEYESVFPDRQAFSEYLESVADVRGRWGQSQMWLAEIARTPVGSLDFYGPGGSPYHSFVGFPETWAAFRFLGTDPDRRGAGVGRGLVEHAIALATTSGATHLGLHTGPFMDSAMRMYERMGFERSSEHDFFPVPDADLRVMGYVRALDPS